MRLKWWDYALLLVAVLSASVLIVDQAAADPLVDVIWWIKWRFF